MITEEFKFGPFKHKVEPMSHQTEWFERTKELEYRGNFWEMGCAKTKPVIDTAAWLFMKGEIDGLLIITEKGVYRNWLDPEIPRHMPENVPYRMGLWQSTCGKGAQAKVNQLLVARDNVLDILIMNVEAFAHNKAPVFAEAFLQSHYGMIVIDESESIGNLKAKRSQAVLQLREQVQYRRVLSGTPISDNPLAIFGQAEFLKKGLIGYDSFVAFRAEFANLMTIDIGQGKRYIKITGYKNLQRLKDNMAKWSDRLLLKECVDMPEAVYEVFYTEHTPEQAQMYQQLKEEALLEFQEGLLTATSAMTAMMKLHQINCGHVRLDRVDEDTDGPVVDIPSNRITDLLSILHKCSGKVIVWACFRRDFELIGEALTKEFGDDSWVDYYGDTTDRERPQNVERFMNDPKCRFFVSNPATGGRGITLIEATYAVYYSYDWRLSRRLQSEKRNLRKGQTKTCVYIDICTPKTIDVRIRASHKAKRELSSQIMDRFTKILDDDYEDEKPGGDVNLPAGFM